MIYTGYDVYSVYIHTNKINGKKYIGITKTKPSKRWKHNGRGYIGNNHFWNSIQKYGWNNFDHEIIATHLTHDEAKNFEIKLIELLNTQDPNNGYNKSKGGDGGGYEVTLETRKKMSKAKIGVFNGDNNPMYGVSPSERMSDETYKEWLYKHKHAKELGITFSTKKIICLTSNEIFDSIIDASKKYDIQDGDISSCCNRKLCSAGKHPITNEKMIWQFYDDYIADIKPKENTHLKKVICYNTGEIFDDIVTAGKYYNVPTSNITLCCQRKYARAGKLHNTNEEIIWQYLDDYNKGILPVNKTKRGFSVQCINTGIIFDSLREAARYYNIKDYQGIKKCCEGIYKKTGKLQSTGESLMWKYV